MTDERCIEIPLDRLSEDALLGVIDDYVLREGTDYGSIEVTLEQKRARVLAQLRAGTALVVFEEETETCTIVLKTGSR